MWPRSNDYTRAVRRSVSARAQHIRCDDHGTDAFRGGYTLMVVVAVRGGGCGDGGGSRSSGVDEGSVACCGGGGVRCEGQQRTNSPLNEGEY